MLFFILESLEKATKCRQLQLELNVGELMAKRRQTKLPEFTTIWSTSLNPGTFRQIFDKLTHN